MPKMVEVEKVIEKAVKVPEIKVVDQNKVAVNEVLNGRIASDNIVKVPH